LNNKKRNSKTSRYQKLLSMFLVTLMLITILPQGNISAYAYSSNISLKVDKTSISGNEAKNGGGIFGETGSEIIIKNGSKIKCNIANNSGGGISISELDNLYIAKDVEFSHNEAEKEAGGILEEHIPIHDKNIKTDTRSIPTEYLYNNYDVGYDTYKVELYIDHELKDTLNVQKGHNINGKIPEEIASLVVGNWYEDENYYFEFYMNTSITKDTKIYARGKKITLTYDGNGGTGVPEAELQQTVCILRDGLGSNY
jgi:hypothetical protein